MAVIQGYYVYIATWLFFEDNTEEYSTCVSPQTWPREMLLYVAEVLFAQLLNRAFRELNRWISLISPHLNTQVDFFRVYFTGYTSKCMVQYYH